MAAIDTFSGRSASLIDPITDLEAITPNDSTDLSYVTRGLYIGGAGNVRVITVGGQTVTLTALAVGVWHPIRVTRVLSTSTTATSIVGGR